MFASSIILMVIPVSFYGKIALEWFILGAVLVKEQIHITALDYIPLSGLFSGYLLGAVASLFLDIAVVKNIFIFFGFGFRRQSIPMKSSEAYSCGYRSGFL